MKYLFLYIILLAIFLVIDLIWLNFLAKDLYQKEIGSLLLKNPKLLPAILFYALFIVAIIILAVIPGIEAKSLGNTLLLGAVLGFISYGTYDFTNLATLNNWSVKVAIIDLIWGTSITTLMSYLGYIIGSKILY